MRVTLGDSGWNGCFKHSKNEDYIRTNSNDNTEGEGLNQLESRVILSSELY